MALQLCLEVQVNNKDYSVNNPEVSKKYSRGTITFCGYVT